MGLHQSRIHLRKQLRLTLIVIGVGWKHYYGFPSDTIGDVTPYTKATIYS